MRCQSFGDSQGWRGNLEVHLDQGCVPSLFMASLPVVSNLSLNTLNDGVLITSRNHHPTRVLESADYAKLLPHFEPEGGGLSQQKKSSSSAPALTPLDLERGS